MNWLIESKCVGGGVVNSSVVVVLGVLLVVFVLLYGITKTSIINPSPLRSPHPTIRPSYQEQQQIQLCPPSSFLARQNLTGGGKKSCATTTAEESEWIAAIKAEHDSLIARNKSQWYRFVSRENEKMEYKLIASLDDIKVKPSQSLNCAMVEWVATQLGNIAFHKSHSRSSWICLGDSSDMISMTQFLKNHLSQSSLSFVEIEHDDESLSKYQLTDKVEYLPDFLVGFIPATILKVRLSRDNGSSGNENHFYYTIRYNRPPKENDTLNFTLSDTPSVCPVVIETAEGRLRLIPCDLPKCNTTSVGVVSPAYDPVFDSPDYYNNSTQDATIALHRVYHQCGLAPLGFEKLREVAFACEDGGSAPTNDALEETLTDLSPMHSNSDFNEYDIDNTNTNASNMALKAQCDLRPVYLFNINEELKRRTDDIKKANLNIAEKMLNSPNSDKSPIYSCCGCGLRPLDAEDNPTKLIRLSQANNFKYHPEIDAARIGRIAQAKKLRDPVSNISYDNIFSYYSMTASDSSDVSESTKYHLHREFVEPPGSEASDGNTYDEPTLRLCAACLAFSRSKVQNVETLRKKAPKTSIVGGVDFGLMSRIGLRPLSPSERAAISLGRPYGTVYKLSPQDAKNGQNPFLRGTCVSFRQEDDTPQKTANLLRPSIDIHKHVSYTFIGPRSKFDERLKNLLPFGKELEPDIGVMIRYLKAYKAVENDDYDNVTIDESESTVAYFSNIKENDGNFPKESFLGKLVSLATIVDNQNIMDIDLAVQSNDNTDALPQAAANLGDCIPTNVDSSITSDDNTYKGDAKVDEHAHLPVSYEHCLLDNDGKDGMMNNNDNEDDGKIADVNVDDDNEFKDENGIKQFLGAIRTAVSVKSKGTLYNEITENDTMLCQVFPDLFPLQHSIPVNGSINHIYLEHLLQQFNPVIANCPQMLFLLFNQWQRHAVMHKMDVMVKNNPVSFQEFLKLLKRPTLDKELQDAIINPKGNRKLITSLHSIFVSMSPMIQYSQAARKNCLGRFLAHVRFFGTPTIFWTVAPDPIGSRRAQRSAFRSTGNNCFPAIDKGFADACLAGKEFTDPDDLNNVIQVDCSALTQRITQSPASAGGQFAIELKDLHHQFFNIPMAHTTRTTSKHETGTFGPGVASMGVIETNGRHFCHTHGLHVNIPSHVVNAITCIPELHDAMSKYIEAMICTSLPETTHCSSVMKNAFKMYGRLRASWNKPSLQDLRDSSDIMSNQACYNASQVNTHWNHGSRCKNKGHECNKTCSQGYPRGINDETQPLILCHVAKTIVFAANDSNKTRIEKMHQSKFEIEGKPINNLDPKTLNELQLKQEEYVDTQHTTLWETKRNIIAVEHPVNDGLVHPNMGYKKTDCTESSKTNNEKEELNERSDDDANVVDEVSEADFEAALEWLLLNDNIKEDDDKATVIEVLRNLKIAARAGTNLSENDINILFRALPMKYKQAFTAAIETRNGKVTDFNPTYTSLKGCNTAMYFLGGGTAARVALFYILKYITKDPTKLEAATPLAALALQSRSHIKRYPSVAENAHTEQRTAQHLLTNMINKGNITSEYSTQLIIAALMGTPAEQTSAGTIHLSMKRAVEMITNNGKATTNARKRSSSNDSDGDENNTKDYNNLHNTGSSSDYDDTDDSGDDCHDRLHGHGDDLTHGDSDFEHDGIDGEDEHSVQKKDSMKNLHKAVHDKSRSKTRGQKSDANASLEGKNNDGAVYIDIVQDEVVLRDILLAYYWRPNEFQEFNLLEFVVSVELKPKQPQNKGIGINVDGILEDVDDNDDVIKAKRRPCSKQFNFDIDSPLEKTHCLKIRSKIMIPILSPPPPKLTDKSKVLVSTYMLTLLRPWNTSEGLTEDTADYSWDSFVAFALMNKLGSDSESKIGRFGELCRYAWIQTFSDDIAPNPLYKEMIWSWRHRCSQKWVDLPKDPDFVLSRMINKVNTNEDAEAVIRKKRIDRGQDLIAELAVHVDDRERMQSNRQFQKLEGYAKDATDFMTKVGLVCPSKDVRCSLSSNSSNTSHSMMSDETEEYKDIFCPLSLTQIDALIKNFINGPSSSIVDNTTCDKSMACNADDSDDSECEGKVTSISKQSPSQEQQEVIETMLKEMTKKEESIRRSSGTEAKRPKNTDSSSQQSVTRKIISAGPGAGKSFVIQLAVDLAKGKKLHTIVMAALSSAANLINGKTMHGIAGLSIKLPPMNEKHISDKLLNELRMDNHIEEAWGVIIDEISAADPYLFVAVEQRIRLMKGNNLPWGGLPVFIIGDFFQLPPASCKMTLYQTVVERFVKQNKGMSQQNIKAAELMIQFELFPFTVDYRAKNDKAHSDDVQSLRSSVPRSFPFSKFSDDKFNAMMLTEADVLHNNNWICAPLLVGSNFVRYRAIFDRLPAIASYLNQPMIKWRLPVKTAHADAVMSYMSAEDIDDLYCNNACLYGYFVKGMGAFLQERIHDSRILSNGTPVTYHSLVLNVVDAKSKASNNNNNNNDEVVDEFNNFNEQDPSFCVLLDANNIKNAKPGDVVELSQPPYAINVKFSTGSHMNVNDYRHCTVVQDDTVIPVLMSSSKLVKNCHVNDSFGPLDITKRWHPIEPDAAATHYKAQGRTMDLVIGDLRHPPTAPYLSFEAAFVFWSRVRLGSCLKCFPLKKGENWDHIRKLTPPDDLCIFMGAFQDGRGKFREDLAAQVWESIKQIDAKDSNTTSMGSKKTKNKKAKIVHYNDAAEPAIIIQPIVQTTDITAAAKKPESKTAVVKPLVNNNSLPLSHRVRWDLSSILPVSRASSRNSPDWILQPNKQAEVELELNRCFDVANNPDIPDTTYLPKNAGSLLLRVSPMATMRDMLSLSGNAWLDGFVISDFLRLLATQVNIDRPTNKQCHVMSSEFWQNCFANGQKHFDKASRLTKKFLGDLRTYLNGDLVFPIHVNGSHWCYCIIEYPRNNALEGNVRIHDPYNKHSTVFDSVIGTLKEWIPYDFLNYNNTQVNFRNNWNFISKFETHVAVQTDYTSCGVFVCMSLYYYIKFRTLPSKQQFNQDLNQHARMFILSTFLQNKKHLDQQSNEIAGMFPHDSEDALNDAEEMI